MNPKQFLQIGGVVLVLVGLLGFFNVLGPDAANSIFGSSWWFDSAENWAHLVLGVVALVAAFVFPANTQKPLVIAVGALGLLAGLYSAFGEVNLLGANLENPADTVLHLVVGAWALWAGMKKAESLPMAM
ncbi:hypothetical protein HYV91_00285 [Candidatus Wolfebacteria bacterium]|nr:hypothetical protein [Candidatus Wolfebacteria bacterium]